jgi:hypothetical protein
VTVIDANDMEYIACPKMDVDLGMSNQLGGGRESQNVGVYEPVTGVLSHVSIKHLLTKYNRLS